MTNDSRVDHPDHYNAGPVECIDALQSALTPEEFAGFCKGNALKYIWREQHKGGTESLRKAVWYLERLIAAATVREVEAKANAFDIPTAEKFAAMNQSVAWKYPATVITTDDLRDGEGEG